MKSSMLRRLGAVLLVICVSATPGESLAQDTAKPPEGTVELKFRNARWTFDDQEIEVIRVKPDGTTEPVTFGESTKGTIGDLKFDTERSKQGTPRVTQGRKDFENDVFNIKLPPGVYFIRITDPTNPEPDRSLETPKFRVVDGKKLPIGVRLSPGSKEAGDQVRIDQRHVVADAATPGHSMAPSGRPAVVFNAGFLAGFSFGGADVSITQDVVATEPFDGENDSVGAIIAADIYVSVDLTQVAGLQPVGGEWAPMLWAGAFAGARGIGGEDDFHHRLDLVNPINPDTSVEIGGSSAFWAPYVGLSLEHIDSADNGSDSLLPTQVGVFVGAHQANSRVDVDFQQPGGHTTFDTTEDSYNPMIGIRVGAEAPFELLDSEVYYSLVYFHVFGEGGTKQTKADQFGNDVTVKVDAGDIDAFMFGASVPF